MFMFEIVLHILLQHILNQLMKAMLRGMHYGYQIALVKRIIIIFYCIIELIIVRPYFYFVSLPSDYERNLRKWAKLIAFGKKWGAPILGTIAAGVSGYLGK